MKHYVPRGPEDVAVVRGMYLKIKKFERELKELRPLLQEAAKALDADFAIQPGSFFHEELKKYLADSA